MSLLLECLWWLGFFTAAIWLQRFLPGLDVLIAGLLVPLRERKWPQLLWLLPLLVCLQEGMGSCPFGSSVAWYTVVILLFVAVRRLFDVDTFLFIFLLSLGLGLCSFALSWLLAPLHMLHMDMQVTLDRSILQALFLPVAWSVVIWSRRWRSAYVAGE